MEFIKSTQFDLYIPENVESRYPDHVKITFPKNRMNVSLYGTWRNVLMTVESFPIDSEPQTESEMCSLFKEKCGHLIEKYYLK